MKIFTNSVDEASNVELTVQGSSTADSELQSILSKQTSTPATHARVLKLKALVRALTISNEMRADELAISLRCSISAIRKYICELRDIDVIEVARRVPHPAAPNGRPLYRLGPNMERAMLITLWGAIEPQKKSKRDHVGTVMDTCLGKLYILEDDLPQTYRPSKVKHRRDPLVAALFGDP
jgi:hypothetical protein